MVLENTKCSEVIHKEFKKCQFCGKELTPEGLDYLYANISPDAIKYERCDCYKAQEHWKKLDEEEYKIERQKRFRNIINKIYKANYGGRKFQEKIHFHKLRLFQQNLHQLKKLLFQVQ